MDPAQQAVEHLEHSSPLILGKLLDLTKPAPEAHLAAAAWGIDSLGAGCADKLIGRDAEGCSGDGVPPWIS
jgi:hypothetical protein